MLHAHDALSFAKTSDVPINDSRSNRFNTSAVYESSAVVTATHQPIRTVDVVEHLQSRAFLEAQLFVVRRDTMT